MSRFTPCSWPLERPLSGLAVVGRARDRVGGRQGMIVKSGAIIGPNATSARVAAPSGSALLASGAPGRRRAGTAATRN